MAYGLVITKRRGMFEMQNEGQLLDLTTGLTHPFYRPETSDPTTIWNVEKHDIVTFTLVDGVATDVQLYKKHEDGVVYYKKV